MLAPVSKNKVVCPSIHTMGLCTFVIQTKHFWNKYIDFHFVLARMWIKHHWKKQRKIDSKTTNDFMINLILHRYTVTSKERTHFPTKHILFFIVIGYCIKNQENISEEHRTIHIIHSCYFHFNSFSLIVTIPP